MEFLPFFIILFVAVLFSAIFQRLHVPWVITLIIGGIAVGPFGFGWLEIDEKLYFLGQIGLIFLMFMAGLETKLSDFRAESRDILTVAILNAGVPFISGMALALVFGMDLIAGLLLGTIFISSSVGVVIPSLQTYGLLSTRPGKIIASVVVFEDIFSLLILTVFLRYFLPDAGLLDISIWSYLALFFVSFLLLRFLVSKLRWFFFFNKEDVTGDEESSELSHDFRIALTVLLGTVVVFGFLGLHPMVGGFFAGLLLSDTITSDKLRERFKVAGYGIFIPVFFIIIGAQTDIGVFFDLGKVFILATAVVCTSMFSKVLSGFFGGKLIGMSIKESLLIGVSTLPQLSITLAIAFIGVELGIITENIATSLVLLTIISTLIAPILINRIGQKLDVKVV